MSSEKISSREQYMNELRHELRRLPRQEKRMKSRRWRIWEAPGRMPEN